jgi:hypothetical protein
MWGRGNTQLLWGGFLLPHLQTNKDYVEKVVWISNGENPSSFHPRSHPLVLSNLVDRPCSLGHGRRRHFDWIQSATQPALPINGLLKHVF